MTQIEITNNITGNKVVIGYNSFEDLKSIRQAVEAEYARQCDLRAKEVQAIAFRLANILKEEIRLASLEVVTDFKKQVELSMEKAKLEKRMAELVEEDYEESV